MLVRRATQTDLDTIMHIYDIGRQFMRAHGNNNQWINGFPQRELISDDIERGICYVVVDDTPASEPPSSPSDTIHGVFAFILGDDPTYTVIKPGTLVEKDTTNNRSDTYIELPGKWLNDEPYGTIHRIASDGVTKGVFATAFSFCKSKIYNIRIDTHRDNFVMQNNLVTKGFVRCGLIYIEDGSERVAFQYTAPTA